MQTVKQAATIAVGVYVGLVAASVTLVWIDYAMWGAP